MKLKLFSVLTLLVVLVACKKDAKESSAAVTTADISAVATNSATTGGEVTSDGGSGISKRGVCYATHPGPTVGDSTTLDGSGTGTFSSSLTNLYSHTQYYVRAYAINGGGTSYGNEINFTTDFGVPSLTTTAVTGILPLKANSGGNVLSDGGSAITARGICWSTSPNPTTANFKTTDTGTTGIFLDTLISLASQTTYYVRSYAVNGFGVGYGNEISFTSSSADAVTDIDGNAYGYITIGTQTWMTSNLKVAHYRNGDPITDGYANNSDFYKNHWDINSTTGAFTYPDNNPENNNVYGKYYDNLTMSDPRGICPEGWHVPSDEEWKTLEIFEGMSQVDADAPYYRGYDPDPPGISPGGRGPGIGPKFLVGGSSGLNLQLAGLVGAAIGTGVVTYSDLNTSGYYWTSTFFAGGSDPAVQPGRVYALYWCRIFNSPRADDPTSIFRMNRTNVGLSIRCMRN